jgi:hypothetical protein
MYRRRVVFSEYTDIAHAFFNGDETGMANVVLDQIARKKCVQSSNPSYRPPPIFRQYPSIGCFLDPPGLSDQSLGMIRTPCQ